MIFEIETSKIYEETYNETWTINMEIKCYIEEQFFTFISNIVQIVILFVLIFV